MLCLLYQATIFDEQAELDMATDPILILHIHPLVRAVGKAQFVSHCEIISSKDAETWRRCPELEAMGTIPRSNVGIRNIGLFSCHESRASTQESGHFALLLCLVFLRTRHDAIWGRRCLGGSLSVVKRSIGKRPKHQVPRSGR